MSALAEAATADKGFEADFAEGGLVVQSPQPSFYPD